jgi:hypothetical protein
MLRAVAVGLVVSACSTGQDRSSASQDRESVGQALESAGEAVLFQWSTRQLEVVSRVPTDDVSWSTLERAWKVVRLDADGVEIDTHFVEPATIVRSPFDDGPPYVVREPAPFMIRWARDARTVRVRLVGEQWTAPSASGRASWEWVQLGEVPWRD